MTQPTPREQLLAKIKAHHDKWHDNGNVSPSCPYCPRVVSSSPERTTRRWT
jgi:hypothetical protein